MFIIIYKIEPNVTNSARNKNHPQKNHGGTLFKVYPQLIQVIKVFWYILKEVTPEFV